MSCGPMHTSLNCYIFSIKYIFNTPGIFLCMASLPP